MGFLLGFPTTIFLFFITPARYRAKVPGLLWGLSLVIGGVLLICSLVYSTVPSMAPRITLRGTASPFIEHRVGKSSKFSFMFLPEHGQPIELETELVPPHWGNEEIFAGRVFNLTYLDTVNREVKHEVIDLEILTGANAGWHDSRDARFLGAWLCAPFGALFFGIGIFGLKYKSDEKMQ